jgi:lysophospholipase L1-like esterase
MTKANATLDKRSATVVARPTPVVARPPFVAAFIRQIVWVALALVGSLLAIEFAFGVAHVGEEELLQFKPLFAFTDFDNKLITFRSEGYSQDKTNSVGFHDSEHTVAKPAGVYRIALLGDSKVEAFQVPLSAGFGKLLEQKLNSFDTTRKYEVLNFGVSAYSTGQEYMLYLDQVAKYKPDVTLLMFHIHDSDENYAVPGDPNPVPRPNFLVENNRLKLDWATLTEWKQGSRARFNRAIEPIRKNSHIWGVYSKLETSLSGTPWFGRLNKILDAICHRTLLKFMPAYNWPTPQLSEVDPAYTESCDKFKPTDLTMPLLMARSPDACVYQQMLAEHRRRWCITEGIIHHLAAACRKDGGRLAVVALPAPNNSLLFVQEIHWLNGLTKREDLQFINLHASFPTYAPMEVTPYILPKMHFSRKGHRLVSGILFDALKDRVGQVAQSEKQ